MPDAPPIVGTTEQVPTPQVVPAAMPSPVSNPLIAAVTSFKLTGNRGVDMMIAIGLGIASLRGAEWGIEHIAYLHKYDPLSIAVIVFGALVTAVSGVYAWVKSHASSNKLAEAVMAGVNLATAGASISVQNADGTVSPKVVTAETATEIIQKYAKVQVKVPDVAK